MPNFALWLFTSFRPTSSYRPYMPDSRLDRPVWNPVIGAPKLKTLLRDEDIGRDAGYLAPPAEIRACS